MANNFRIVAGNYISLDGDDLNSGLDADNPKATFARYGADQVAGTGEYKGAFSLNTTATNTTYLADAFVKLKLTADAIINTNASFKTTLGSLNAEELFLIDCNGFGWGAGTSGFQDYYNVVFENGLFKSNPTDITVLFNKCVLANMSTSGTVGMRFSFEYSKLFNTTIDSNNGFAPPTVLNIKNSYVDSASTILISGYFTTPATQFINNNFQGILNVGGTNYELKRDRAGNAIDPNPSIADIIAIDPTVYDRGNFSEDPAFLNLPKRDYWNVSSSSPLLLGDSTGTQNIGDVLAGAVITILDSELSSGATITDLIVSSGDLIYDTGSGSGKGDVLSGNIQAFPIAQQLARVMFAILINANTLEAIGSAENKNFPATQNYLTGSKGANPRRFQYEIMWTNSNTVPLTDADYTNNGYFAAGTMAIMEMFKIPKVDINGLGNGHPDFIVSGSVPILGKHFKCRITLLEGAG